MEQIDGDLFTYSVEAHETVVIEVTPVGVGNFASVNIDSKAQPKSFTYSFPVTKPSDGEHDVVMEFEFPGVVDPNARYDVKLTSTKNGSPNGGPFSFNVKNSDTLKEADLTFTVT
jgi:hypothetical protein